MPLPALLETTSIAARIPIVRYFLYTMTPKGQLRKGQQNVLDGVALIDPENAKGVHVLSYMHPNQKKLYHQKLKE